MRPDIVLQLCADQCSDRQRDIRRPHLSAFWTRSAERTSCATTREETVGARGSDLGDIFPRVARFGLQVRIAVYVFDGKVRIGHRIT